MPKSVDLSRNYQCDHRFQRETSKVLGQDVSICPLFGH